MTGSSLLIRADASLEIGTGHIMRCLALAQQWRATSSGPVTLLSVALPNDLEKRVAREGVNLLPLNAEIGSVADLQMTVEAARVMAAKWILLDGYNFDESYQEELRRCGSKVLLLDDSSVELARSADIILNQNAFADPACYRRCDTDTRLLLGTRYALLRSEFKEWRSWQREIHQDVANVLVTLGGADGANVTEQVLGALDEYRDRWLQIRVIVGPAYAHTNALRKKTERLFHDTQIIENPTDMPKLMAWADLLICAASTTTLEAAFMGLPCIVGEVADNQRPVAEALSNQQLAVWLGDYGEFCPRDLVQATSKLAQDVEGRRLMSANGRMLVDGRGAQRVVKHMQAPNLQLRPVAWRDRHLLWQWANQPTVRQASFSQGHVDWEQHVKWLAEKLNVESARMYIGISDGEPVGVIRYARQKSSAVVSVNLSERHQGKGLGPVLITAGNSAVAESWDVQSVDAYVRKDNLGSVLAFYAAGFELMGEVVVADQAAWHLKKRLISRAPSTASSSADRHIQMRSS